MTNTTKSNTFRAQIGKEILKIKKNEARVKAIKRSYAAKNVAAKMLAKRSTPVETVTEMVAA